MCRLEPGGAEARAQGRLSSDRGVRRDGRGGRRRGGARLDRRADRRCARHRRLDGRRHHRISRRGRLDQAHACRLGGAVGPARGAAGARTASSARAPCSRARTACSTASPTPPTGDYAALIRRFRRALGDRDARLQALSVRDHDASLHRLRAAARRARHQGGRRSRRWCARSARAPCTGCGSRSPPSSGRPTAMPANSPRPTASPPAFVHGNVGLDAFTDEAVKDDARARAGREGALRDRSATIPIRTTSPATSARCLRDGRVVEERQPHMRGGAHEPLTRAGHRGEIRAQCARHGGWDAARTEQGAGARRARCMTAGSIFLCCAGMRGYQCVHERQRMNSDQGTAVARSSPAPAAISAAPSRWRWPTAAPPSSSTRAPTRPKPRRWCGEIEATGGKAIVVIADVADRGRGRDDGGDRRRAASAASTILVNNAALRRGKARSRR